MINYTCAIFITKIKEPDIAKAFLSALKSMLGIRAS
jgi:hypothetical protein